MNDPKKPDVKEGVAPNAQQFVPKAGAVLVEGQRASTSEATRRVVDFNESCETLNGVTILLVDDNSSIRSGAKRLLKSYGANCLEASNIQEAMDALGNLPIGSIVLSDDNLGGSERGMDLVKNLKYNRPDLAIYMWSGSLSHAEAKLLIEEGIIEDLFTKPYKISDFVNLLVERRSK